MIRSDPHRAGGGGSSGLCGLGCVLAVLLVGCRHPAPFAGPAAASAPAPAVQPTQAATRPAGNAERGLELYEARCGACHSVEANRVGPKHEGLFGRTAGKLKDYDYSTAVEASKIVWNETTLDAWLKDPQAFIPGQKMNYSVPDATDRADIIAYLRTATSAK